MTVRTVELETRLVDIPSFVDERGMLHQVTDAAQGILPRIARVYDVRNFEPGTIRGFHLHRREWKAFHVAVGAAKFAVRREGGGELLTFVLTDRNPRLLVVPPGHYNGWRALEPNTLLFGFSSATIEESLRDDERVDPFHFGDCWKVQGR